MNHSHGRIRPLLIALILLIAGLVWKDWMWQIGVVMVIALFVEAFYHYRTPKN